MMLNRKNIYILFQIIVIIIGLLIGNIINYLNISMYLTLLLVILLYKNNSNLKGNKITNIFSIIFSLFFSFGNINGIEKFETYNIPIIIYYIVSILCYYYLFKNILLFIYNKTKNLNITDNKKKEISKTKFLFIITIIGFILYIPYLLEYYPGITTFDTYTQLNQILGNSVYSNHHPVIHTLIIKLFYSIGYGLSKSENIGILCFTIFQMLFVSFTFSNVLYSLYKNNIKKIYLILLFIFYYLVPYNALYSISTYKDVLFSCIALLFILFLYNNKDNKLSLLKIIELILLTIFTCILRTNGIIGVCLLLIILLIKKHKIFIKYIGIGLILSFVFNILLINIFNVEKVESIESFAIPIQNISYVIKNEGNISEDELKILNELVDIEKVKEVYDVDYVDPVKNIINSDYLNSNKINFVKLWMSIGVKNINMYIKSYVYQTSGYWYHNYGVNTIPITDNYDDLGIVHKSYNLRVVSKILNILIYLNRGVQHVLWSNALSIYMILYSLYYLIRKKKYDIYIYPILFIWLTLLMATPVGYEFRYQYSVFISFPFILMTIFNEGVREYEKKNN